MTREYNPRETRWVEEFVQEFYKPAEIAGRVSYQVSLGPLAGSVFSRSAPRADAIIELPDRVVILEAETENITSAVGQLLYYEFAYPYTPGKTEDHRRRDMVLLLLDIPGSFFLTWLARFPIRVNTWAPDWLVEYVRVRGLKRA